MIKIAISGKLGSGKDLFLNFAQAQYPELNFKNEKFAQPIYDVANLIQERLFVPRVKDGRLLQLIGEHYRNTYPDIWVDTFLTTGHDITRNVIVTDLRFPNELEACKRNGFILVRVLRKDELRLNNLGNRDVYHESETALDDISNQTFDYTINNNGSLELYEGAVHTIIENILWKTRRAA